ncbi:MAG: transposase [Ignavibacteriaceae bacterium]|nr:transposase [Ignavibacteriaceae bacterium]
MQTTEKVYYHVYNRGANKTETFLDNEDYNFFLKKLNWYSKNNRTKILAFALMPNHFHLFLFFNEGSGNLSALKGNLLNSYTKYFNKKYSRSGVLFQGPTVCKKVEDGGHQIWLLKYITDNPVKAGLVNHSWNWPFSSAHEFKFNNKTRICDHAEVMSMFESVAEFNKFIWDESDEAKEKYFTRW